MSGLIRRRGAVVARAVVATAFGCSSAPPSLDPVAPTSPLPKMRTGTVHGAPIRETEPPARVVPVADACRGASLTLDAELSPCACHDTETVTLEHGEKAWRGGGWCGLPHPNEANKPSVEVSAERTVLAPGEGTVVLVRVTNAGPKPLVYRARDRHMMARLVQPSGMPLPGAVLGSGDHRDEALFELPPGGTMSVRLPVAGTYARWVGAGDGASTEVAKLAPGRYAIQVFDGQIDRREPRLIPVDVR